MKLTKKQINKRYKGKYIEVRTLPIWDTNEKGERLYEVITSYNKIHENTCRGEDVGTPFAFTR